MSDARVGSAVSAEGGVPAENLVKMELGGLGQATLIKNSELFLGGRDGGSLDFERGQFLLLTQGEGEGEEE